MSKSRLAGLVLGAFVSVMGTAAQAAPIDIDVVLSLSGGGAFLGKAQQSALQHLEDAIAKGAIQAPLPHFVFYDDQSNPQTAIQLATSIVAKKPPVILGSTLVAGCSAMVPLMKNGPVMYCFAPGIHPPAGSFAFSSGVDTRDLATALIRYWRLSGITKLGLITSTDASGQDAERNIREIMKLPENKDMTIVGDARFAPTDVSVTAQIERIKETNPQALIAWTTGGPVATVFKAVSAAGMDIPVGTTNGNMTYAQMQQYKDFLPKELVIPTSSWMETPAGSGNAALDAAHAPFYAVYKAAAEKPDSPATLGWDPTLFILQLMGELGPNVTAEQLRAKMAETRSFTGVNGLYDFVTTPQRGLDERSVIVSHWDPAAGTWTRLSGPGGVPQK